MTFELVNIPPFTPITEVHCPGQQRGGGGGEREGLAGEGGVGGHLLSLAEFEWDRTVPIPAFVPLTGEIPGLSD